MKKRTIISLFFALFTGTGLLAQVISGDTLPLFEVLHNRIPASNPGLREETFGKDNPFFRQSLALGDILSRSGTLFIRINSNGALASPSLRGMGPAHTALIWNGFNLQSSMNGQSDLNLISPLLFDQFTLQPGAGAALWGSNAAGGTLHITSLDTSSSLSIGQLAGSWNNRSTFLRSSYVRGRVSASVRIFRQDALNNYLYRDPSLPFRPFNNQVNAAFEHNALTANLRVLTGKSNYFRLSIWWQESDRQLPPLVTTPAAFASQYDNVLRASANWTGQVGIGEMQVRTGLFREKIHFHDSLHHLNAQNTAHTLVQEAEWSVPIRNRHRFQAGVNHTYNWAMADGYHHPLRTQRRAALFASAGSAWYNKRLQTLLAMRQEWYDVHTAPAIPSFSASWRFNSSYLVRTQFAATFRIPTLNDLYWIPGGNPDLKPERGKSAEFSLEYARSAKAFHVSWNSGFFINQVNSRILWEPGSFYWKPSNIGQVTSMGVESRIELHVQTGRNHFKMLLNAQYVRSGVTGEKRGQFIPEQQLIYTPFLLSSGLLEFRRGYFTAFIQGTYNGLRYTSSDNSQSLPGFFLADAGFNLDLPVNTVPMGLFFSCRNMFNTAYEVTLWRPMALRSWHAGIQFFIQKSNPNQS